LHVRAVAARLLLRSRLIRFANLHHVYTITFVTFVLRFHVWLLHFRLFSFSFSLRSVLDLPFVRFRSCAFGSFGSRS